MAYRLQSNFAGGELDPVLRKRVTLNKYGTGLATARNVIIAKTGRILSRPGRKYIKDAGNLSGGSITIGANKKVIVHPMPWKSRYFEFGEGYCQVYEADGTVVNQSTHSFTAADFDRFQFVNVRIKNAYNSSLSLNISYGDGYATLILDSESGNVSGIVYDDGRVAPSSLYFLTPAPPTMGALDYTVNGTGYDIEYAITSVINGEESEPLYTSLFTDAKLPVASSATNLLTITVEDYSVPTGSDISDSSTEVRVYRRPLSGGAYGFIGSTKKSTLSSGDLKYAFEDFGQVADYTNQPPEYTSGIYEEYGFDPSVVTSIAGERTASMYQGRLVLGLRDKILASRPGKPGNFFRDYPLDGDSAVSTNIEGDGNSVIYHLLESDGLIAFTSNGIYLHQGVLSATNLAFDRKANYVIDYRIPPLNLPGGPIFVDSRTNTVRQLKYSEEKRAYVADEVSIFSDHLFRENRITSWAFDEGSLPLLYVTFADGTFATFTYEESQEVRAWTRHDSGKGIEQVSFLPAGFNSSGEYTDARLIFVVKETSTASSKRWIEHGIPRLIKAEELESNPEADKGEKIAAMDSIVSCAYLINDYLTDDDLTLTPVVSGEWSGNLTLACVDDAIFPSPGRGAIGTIFRHFHPIDGTAVDLEVIARASDNSVTVAPTAEFPSDYDTNMRLYETKATITGLDHLDGEEVSVIVDGYVIASPNNDEQDYPTLIPSSGSLDLPGSLRGAIIHVGRPYTMDVETLQITTVEQRPTHNESITCDKVKVDTYLSRGVYVGSRFPSDNKVKGTQNDKAVGKTLYPLHGYIVDSEEDDPIVGNRYDAPSSQTHEITIPGDWKSSGRVCFRQVDPIHFEILAITPDIDDQRR